MDAAIRDLTEKRLTEIAELTAQAYGAVARVTYDRNYPIMVIYADVETGFAIEAAKKVAGDCADAPLIMGGEDFAFMLNSRPGAYRAKARAEAERADYEAKVAARETRTGRAKASTRSRPTRRRAPTSRAILVGNGDTAMVHHPEYDFNDEAIPAGCSWWVEMAEGRLTGCASRPGGLGILPQSSDIKKI